MAIDEVQFARLRDKFTDEWKKVEHIVSDRRALPKSLSKRTEYRENITKTFNAICTYLIRTSHSSNKLEEKLECVARIRPYIEKCKRAFIALKLQYNWPEAELSLIDINSIKILDEQLPTPVDTAASAVEPQASGSNTELASSTGRSDTFVDAEEAEDTRLDEIIRNLSNIIDDSDESNTVPNSDQIEQNQQQIDSTVVTLEQQQVAVNTGDNNLDENPSNHSSRRNSQDNLDLQAQLGNLRENLTTMVQSKEDFFKMASSVIREKFDGDPLQLDSFLTDAEFIESMTENGNKETFLKFIKTKISGRAKECLPEDDEITTFKDIKDALKKDIKPYSSLVIEGKMATLRLVKGDFTKFTDEAGKLAEAYRRSLIFEKHTREKAGEMTILKTKEVCRRIARSDITKSVIQSTKFDNAAEVIATLVTQSETARKEKKELESFQKQHTGKPNNKNGQKFGNKPNNFKGKKFQEDNKKFNKSNKNYGNNSKSRGGQNDHVIRIVTDAQPSTSGSSKNSENAEQVFRLAQS